MDVGSRGQRARTGKEGEKRRREQGRRKEKREEKGEEARCFSDGCYRKRGKGREQTEGLEFEGKR